MKAALCSVSTKSRCLDTAGWTASELAHSSVHHLSKQVWNSHLANNILKQAISVWLGVTIHKGLIVSKDDLNQKKWGEIQSFSEKWCEILTVLYLFISLIHKKKETWIAYKPQNRCIMLLNCFIWWCRMEVRHAEIATQLSLIAHNRGNYV